MRRVGEGVRRERIARISGRHRRGRRRRRRRSCGRERARWRLEEYARSLRTQWPVAVERAAQRMRLEDEDARRHGDAGTPTVSTISWN